MPGAIRSPSIARLWVYVLALSCLLRGGHCPAAEALIRFDVPAGPLEQMLDVFGTQANLNILINSPIAQGLQAPALHGKFTARRALARLLDGQHLHGVETDSDTVTIETDRITVTVDAPASSGTRPHHTPGEAVGALGGTARKAGLDEVVVTGGYLQDLSTLLPIVSITRQQLIAQGYVELGQYLAQLPKNFAGLSAFSNPIVGNARGAVDNQTFAVGVDLFGLGPGTTLVLLNGRRLPGSVIGQSVDVSCIPMSAIDHVDIMLDGGSATYGSDALGGVVDVVTVGSFSGFEGSVRAGGISKGKKADPGGHFTAGGIPWRGAAGLVTVDLEQANPLYAAERAFTASAPGPTNLLPEQQAVRGYANLSQDFGHDIVVKTDVLFSSRRFNAYDALYGYLTTLEGRADQLDATLQLDSKISRTWSLNLAAQLARERDVVRTAYSSVAPANTDRYLNQAPSLEARITGSLGRIAGQDARIALGAAFRREEFQWQASYGPAPLSTRRNVISGFGEFLIPLVRDASGLPLIREVTLDLSGRYDSYNGFGSSWDPRVALQWKMSDTVAWHTSLSKSFRSATLYQLHSPPFAELIAAADPAGSMQTVDTLLIDGGNTQLAPERSFSVEVGLSYQPEALRELRFELSASQIDYTQRIDQLSQDGFTSANVLVDAPLLGQLVNLAPTLAQVQHALNTPGLLQYPAIDASQVAAIAYLGFENVGSISVRNLDSNIHYTHEFGGGQALTAELDSTYFARYDVHITPQSARTSLVGGAYRPSRSRSKLNVSLAGNDWTVNGRLNLIGSYHNDNDPACPTASGCPVSGWLTLDWAVAYSGPDSGNSLLCGTRVALGVTNIFNSSPPYLYASRRLNFDPANANPWGRMLTLTVTKTWGHR